MTRCRHCGREIRRVPGARWMHVDTQQERCSTTIAEPEEA